MLRLIVLFFMIIGFSLLSLFELFKLKELGFDVVAKLKMDHKSEGFKVYFEAAGIIAFIIVQPIVFCLLLVWLSNNIKIEILAKAMNFIGIYRLLN